MRTLIVEDDFISRHFLIRLLGMYGHECDVAVNGEEALDAFQMSLDERRPYRLICLDILMPRKDGLQTLKEIRQLEWERDGGKTPGVKVIMTTALSDSKHIMQAFQEQCESYIIKPITKDKLDLELKKLDLLPAPSP